MQPRLGFLRNPRYLPRSYPSRRARHVKEFGINSNPVRALTLFNTGFQGTGN